nr:iron ABC transporter permease [Corynebacterium lactis]
MKLGTKARPSGDTAGSEVTGRAGKRRVTGALGAVGVSGTLGVFLALAAALLLAVGWSASVGQFGAGIGQSLKAAASLILAGGPGDNPTPVETVLWQVRLPRIALAALVGAGLALAGVALQAVFGNPLAEPGLIGVSSGAAVGAAAATVLGTTSVFGGASTAVAGAAGSWVVALCAFAGGALATAVVAATASGGRDIARIILVGVAVNAICGGAVSFLTYVASTSARDRIVFWQMGSFASADWTQASIIAVVTVPAVAAMWGISSKLDILSLGAAQARHLGINVVVLRRGIIAATALVVAAGVAFSGIIVFIGLVVPHAARLLLGPAHRTLIPACILGGALATTLADLAARTLLTGADLPLGMLTSIVGGPLFFWLLLRSNRAVH